ncbi:MAG: nitrate reductase, partial [Sulfurimonadaceae bacterium]
MKKVIGALLLLVCLSEAKDIAPLFRLHTIGFVTDFVLDGNRIYVANDMGVVDIFDLGTGKIVDQIVLEPIRSGRGELVPARITGIDRLNAKTLIVSSGENNYRNVWIEEMGRLTQIIDEKKKLVIKEARFVNDERILFGTFDSDVILYNMTENYEVYHRSNSQSALCDISLSTDGKKMVTSDESGTVKLFDVESSKVEQELSSENVDRVYSVAYRSSVIITGGQDRRVGVYRTGEKPYHLKSDFLVYSVGLSP